jgi:hypothetical protein
VSLPEFKPFSDIKRIGKLEVNVTQKIHGTNAQVYITDDGQVYAGSRTRWLSIENDNYGFAKFVEENKEALLACLGPGHHFGEWAGPGINSGEGLPRKTLVLFDFWKYPAERPLPADVCVVPLLYRGSLDSVKINAAIEDLKLKGSVLVPGFMRPEGAVISVGGARYKHVFEPEETAWKKGEGQKEKIRKLQNEVDVDYLLQPIRLEKLLSRDESYLRKYPDSLPRIVSYYVADLIKEDQITGTEAEVKAFKKALGPKLFAFVKSKIKL